MIDTNITMTRGDTMSFGVEYDGTTQDLDAAFFVIKKADGIGDYVIKSLGNGINKCGTGKYIVRVAPEDTANRNAGEYPYALRLKLNSDVFTILKGTLTITADQMRI